MAQHDYVIDNQGSAAARADLNNLFQAIATQNSGDTAPATTYANMFWYETDTNILWKRNELNSAWISLGTLDETNSKFEPNQTFATQAQAEAGTENTKAMTALRTAQAIAALAVSGGMTLLGTLTTTSGTSQTLSSLVLTDYKFLRLSIEGVSLNGTTGTPFLRFGTDSTRQITAGLTSSSNQWRGQVVIDLATGLYVSTTLQSGVEAISYVGYSGITTASTSLTISASNQNFDLGSIKVYGEK
jgi:hypothetical protein